MSEDTGGFMASEELLREEQKDVDTRKKDILNQLDAVVEAVSDDVSADLEAVEKNLRNALLQAELRQRE